jgi:hypothetical protein
LSTDLDPNADFWHLGYIQISGYMSQERQCCFATSQW